MQSTRLTPDEIRVQKLGDFNILDTPPELDFDELAGLVALICGVPTALVSFVDKERQWFKARVGINVDETPRDISFCTHTIEVEQDDLLVIADTHLDARFADNPLVTGPENIRFYAGAPIVTQDGYAIGTLCAIDHQPRVLKQEQLDALRSLARHAMKSLELRRLQRAYADLKLEFRETKNDLEHVRMRLKAQAA